MLLKPLEPIAAKMPLAEGLHAALRLAYGEPAAYGVLDDIGALSNVRDRAHNCSRLGTEKEAAAAAAALGTYYAVLAALARPFTAAVIDDLGTAMPALPFAWKSGVERPGAPEVAKSPRPVLERASVLFNLAAAHCARGALLPRTDAEEIKAAAKAFQVATGVLEEVASLDLAAALQLGEKALLPPELCREGAKALALAMLARAQECFCAKAEVDGMAAGTRIKLLLGARDAYAAAADALSDTAVGKRLRARAEPIARAKQHMAEAKALWLAANPSPTPAVGLGLALASRAQASVLRAVAAAAALEESDRNSISELAAEIASVVARLTRDNDTVYYESVPPESSLPVLEGKVLAKALPVAILFEAAEAAPLPPSLWPGRGGGATASGGGSDEPPPPCPAELFMSLAGATRRTKTEIAKAAAADAAEGRTAVEEAKGFFGTFFEGWAAAATNPGSSNGSGGGGGGGGGAVGERGGGGGEKGGGGGGAASDAKSRNEQVSRVQEILARGRETKVGNAPEKAGNAYQAGTGSGAAAERKRSDGAGGGDGGSRGSGGEGEVSANYVHTHVCRYT